MLPSHGKVRRSLVHSALELLRVAVLIRLMPPGLAAGRRRGSPPVPHSRLGRRCVLRVVARALGLGRWKVSHRSCYILLVRTPTLSPSRGLENRARDMLEMVRPARRVRRDVPRGAVSLSPKRRSVLPLPPGSLAPHSARLKRRGVFRVLAANRSQHRRTVHPLRPSPLALPCARAVRERVLQALAPAYSLGHRPDLA